MTDDLIEVYRYVPQLVSHLHLPVQSGSNEILKRMKRNYTTELFEEVIYKIKEIRPELRVSSDFIVGFPGESQQDFEETMSLVKKIKFDSSYSFIYSARPGTPASKLNDETPMKEKKERLFKLQSMLDSFHKGYSEALQNSIQRCLVTGVSKKSTGQFQARTECNRVVNFDFQNHSLIGKLVDIKINEAYSNSLQGTLIEYN